MPRPALSESKGEAQAFWVTAPGHGEIRDEPVAAPDGASVIVRARYSGISRGTEALVFNGRVPASEYQRMRAPFQEGEFPAPVKFGYASVGEIEAGPPGLEGLDVFVLYPHQTRYCVPIAAVHVLPTGVPPGRAVLAANLETAINVVWDARPHIGDRVTVVGAGTVGCLIAWVAKRAGCDVALVDVNPSRRAVARHLNIGFTLPDESAPDADAVIHASGSAEGLDLACRLAGFESTVVEASWYGTQVVPLPLGEAFHARRLILKSSQVGTVATSQRARWDHGRRMRLALSMLTEPALDALITGESEFAELPAVMSRLAAAAGDTLCHRIRY
jgi:threonine dehydrogenase-like Zn-dependent dehydrogenase